jgi:hypothetical protein
MLGEFQTVEIGGERLVRVRLFDSRYGVANLHGQRWPSCVFDEVMTEAVALRLSFDLWRDIVPCWQSPRRAKKQRPAGKFSSRAALNAKVSPEEEAELPTRFQRDQTVIEHNKETKTDRVDKEVADELARYRTQVGRELTAEETAEIMRSPKMHCWIRWCKSTHEHNKKRLVAEGWVQVEYEPGNWRWEKKQ